MENVRFAKVSDEFLDNLFQALKYRLTSDIYPPEKNQKSVLENFQSAGHFVHWKIFIAA